MTKQPTELETALRDLVRKSRYTRNEIARRAGFSSSILSRFMNGRTMRMKNACKLAKALGKQLRVAFA